MVADLDGRQRLPIVTDEDGNRVVSPKVYLDAWADVKQKVLDEYQPSEEKAKEIEEQYNLYAESLNDYLAENGDAIVAHFDALDRFAEEKAAGNNGADFQKKRTWDKMMDLRTEVNAWLGDIEKMGEEYRLALWGKLADEQKKAGPIPEIVPAPLKMPVPVPMVPTQSKGMDLAVTYGLTAIGLCLIVGFCTRLANLGGAAFLISVLLTQPPWPSIYPHAPDVVGHALVVDKNFVEMMAMLTLATLPVGRWGGLDFFLYRMFGRKRSA